MNNIFSSTKKFSQHKSAIIAGSLCVILGMLSGTYTSIDDYTWYNHLNQPDFAPPKWLFAPVWTILYFMIGVAFNKILRQKPSKKLLDKIVKIIVILHLISNLVWSYIFFSMRRIDLALYDLIFIWVSLIVIIITTKKIKSVYLWLLPYLAWTSFALMLNFAVYNLNSA